MNESKIDLIRKLMAKAESTNSEHERDALNAKATALMIEYGIEEAMLSAGDRAKVEQIIMKEIILEDVPKSYSHEFSSLVINVAKVLNLSGFLLTRSGYRKDAMVIGFESDIERAMPIIKSLVWQCTDGLQKYGRNHLRDSFLSGTDKYNARKGFVTGFRDAVIVKMRATVKETVAKVPGAELALVDRQKQADDWMNRQFSLNKGRPRSYGTNGYIRGTAAGQRADVGQGKVGGSRTAIR